MPPPRLYTPQPLVTGSQLLVEGQTAHHVLHVLRLRSGATVALFDGRGHEHLATLDACERSSIVLRIGAPVTPRPDPSLDITLLQGIPRKEHMDFILQKSVELGVNAIQPVWMQRSQSHLGSSQLVRREQHWRAIVINACEQCGRARLPELLPAVAYGALDHSQGQPGLRLLLEPGGDISLSQLEPAGNRITLLVGPEGGMTDSEMEQAIMAGFKAIRMGQRVLRTETAALAAISAIQTLWGDFT